MGKWAVKLIQAQKKMEGGKRIIKEERMERNG